MIYCVWQECMREQSPVFFDSLVLPNPRGLVSAKSEKR